MSWFRRRINRWRNYFSDGDDAGCRGAASSTGGSDEPGRSIQSTASRESAITEVRTRGSVGPGG